MKALHLAVLRQLEGGPLDVGVLAQRTQQSPSKVGRTLTSLEREGRIELESVGSIRVARLTPRGRAA